MRLGEFLRNERIRRGIDLETAAEETRIKEVYLSAIEDENYDLIPGELYQRHYFKTYLEYLGHGDLYFRLTRERPKPAQMSDKMVREPMEDMWDTSRYVRVIWRLALLVLFAVIAIWFLAWGTGRIWGGSGSGQSRGAGGEHKIEILPYVPDLGNLEQEIHDSVGGGADLGDISGQIAGALEEHTLRIDVDGVCWFRVSGPNGILRQGEMQPGDSLEFGPERFFIVSLGKPENAWVYLDNKHYYGGDTLDSAPMRFKMPPEELSDEEIDNLLDSIEGNSN